MKVIGICGSPRKGGNTEIMLRRALKAAEAKGAETELILLADKKVEHCKGCTPKCEDPCSINDDMPGLLEKLKGADGIILGAPSYYCMYNSLTKAFIDRTVPLDRGGSLLKGKAGGVIIVGGMRHGGQEAAANAIKNWMTIQGILVVDDSSWTTSNFSAAGNAYNQGDIEKDTEGLKSAEILGEKIVDLINKLE